MLNFEKLVKQNFLHLDSHDLLKEKVSALASIGNAQAEILEKFEIFSIFDLASSRIFHAANEIARTSIGESTVISQFGSVPAEIVHQEKRNLPLEELAHESVKVLRGIEEHLVTDFAQKLQVHTIYDLGTWPPYLTAKSLLTKTFGLLDQESTDTEAPEDLVPGARHYPTETVYYKSIVLDSVTQTDSNEEINQPIDLASKSKGFTKPLTGAVLKYEQSWYRVGLALGQLLHSVALAPGESTNIAVIDWRRREVGTAEEEVSQTESLRNITEQRRVLNEVTQAVAHESQSGESDTSSYSETQTGGYSQGSGQSGESASAAYNTTYARTFSSSEGDRSVTASMAQNLRHSTQQHATSARNRHATVVREVSQSEKEEITTRTVTNYNHMHALTVQYHEVLQLYRTVLRLVKVERCLFIPLKPFDFSDESVISRYRVLLIAAALDPYTRDLLISATSMVNFEFLPDRELPIDEGGGSGKARRYRRKIQEKEQAKKWAKLSANFNRAAIAGGVESEDRSFSTWSMPVGTTLIKACWENERIEKINIHLEDSNTPLEIDRSDVILDYPLEITQISSVIMKFTLSSEPEILELKLWFRSVAGKEYSLNCNCVLGGDIASAKLLTASAPPRSGELSARLNAQAYYYSQSIWMNMPVHEIVLALADYTFEGKRVVEYIDASPIAVAGNCLGFRWHDEEASSWQEWLKRHGGTESFKPEEDMVSIPTGGVFGEAVLGRSNSAEKLDITRFWNWQDSPIQFPAPDIAAISAGSRDGEMNLQTGDLENSMISLSTPGSLPDPQGMAATLSALSTPGLFRDMSGVAHTAGLAQAGLVAATHAAMAAGSQAGANMATAGQFQIEALKAIMPLVTTAVGAAMGIPIPPIGGGSGTSNISNAGASMNYGEALDKALGGAGGGAGGSTSSASGSHAVDAFGKTIGRNGYGSSTSTAGSSAPSSDVSSLGNIPTSLGGTSRVGANAKNTIASVLRTRATLGQLGDAGQLPDFTATLKEWYDLGVLPTLRQAENDDQLIRGAVREFLDWMGTTQLIGATGLDNKQAQGLSLAISGLKNAIKQSNERLKTNGDVNELKNIEELLATAQLLGAEGDLGIGEGYEDINAEIEINSFNVDPPVVGEGEIIKVMFNTGLVIGQNQAIIDPPLNVTVRVFYGAGSDLNGEKSFSGQTDNRGRYEIEIPLTEDSTDFHLYVIVTTPLSNLISMQKDTRVEGALKVEYRGGVSGNGPLHMSPNIINGETVILHFQVKKGAGHQEGIPVRFSLSGGGGIDPNSVTTDTDGCVQVVYTAPDNGQGSVTVACAAVAHSSSNTETATIVYGRR